jgi:vacuolar-type H+-ATPase subunit B/Vma2
MDDREVLHRINTLVAEEKDLRHRHGSDGLSDPERDRLREIEESLDQCWDLLRQRRAREEAGTDPDAVAPRPVGEVESYLQ